MASALSALRAACQHGGEPDIVAAEFATESPEPATTELYTDILA